MTRPTVQAAPQPPGRRARSRVLFMTGTDTGVGKTVVTCLLLRHLRAAGVKAVAMKPFATGDRADARWLNALQETAALSLDEVNPFVFRVPIAPLVAARQEGRCVSLVQARKAIARLRARADVLLVEGCGGLRTPLGERYTLLHLMPRRGARVIVVAANRLGVLNHACLTVERLAGLAHVRLHLVLVNTTPPATQDASCDSNLEILRELLAPVTVCALPFLGAHPEQPRSWQPHREALDSALAELARMAGD